MKRVCLVVTIVRHAETDMNAQGKRVLQGQLDTSINSFGEKQAAALANRLRHDKFDRIYTSDLKRATQTAEIIGEHHPTTTISTDKRLREMDLGDLTGMSWKDAKTLLRKEDRHLEDHVKEKGESDERFQERVLGFYGDIINTHLVSPHREGMDALARSPGPRLSAPARVGRVDDTIAEKGQRPQSDRASDLPKDPAQAASPRTKLTVSTSFNGNATSPRSPGAPSPLPHPSLAPSSLAAHTPSSAGFSGADLPSPTTQLSIHACRRLRKQHILIVTHGGWIKKMTDHLLNDLEFDVKKEVRGFPKNSAVYRFTISWMPTPAMNDYEWKGRRRADELFTVDPDLLAAMAEKVKSMQVGRQEEEVGEG
ncbi:histidine phosphatase superfamily [Zopfochytrium polystomum]|nr:histidine phosphatase superfamily [Zopfochytrium polystomum]